MKYLQCDQAVLWPCLQWFYELLVSQNGHVHVYIVKDIIRVGAGNGLISRKDVLSGLKEFYECLSEISERQWISTAQLPKKVNIYRHWLTSAFLTAGGICWCKRNMKKLLH